MLIWIIFLVLSAVVLTILGVGILDALGTAKKTRTEEIGNKKVAGRYTETSEGGFIEVADAIKRSNRPVYRLEKEDQKFVLYHERFHEIASKLGYAQAEREDYADLAAAYALIIEGDVKTARKGIKFLEKTGRKDSINDISISAINKVLGGHQDQLTKDEEAKFSSGMNKTGNLINAAYESLPTEEHGLSEKYHMSISPVLYDAEGKSRITKVIGGISKFITDIYSNSGELETAIKGAYDKKSNKYKDTPELAKKIGSEFLTEYVYKPLKIKK